MLERKSNNTLERRRRPEEEDPKENDNNNSKKKTQSAFLLCRDDLRRRQVSKKKKKSVCFVAPFNTKCRENIEEALTKREREEEATQKKGIKLSRKKKRFLKTYDLGFRVLLKPRKKLPLFLVCLSLSL